MCNNQNLCHPDGCSKQNAKEGGLCGADFAFSVGTILTNSQVGSEFGEVRSLW